MNNHTWGVGLRSDGVVRDLCFGLCIRVSHFTVGAGTANENHGVTKNHSDEY